MSPMDQLNADEVAKAILEPDTEFHDALRRRRAAEERNLADRRQLAWFGLAGAAIGTVVALMAGVRFTNGTLWGAIAGSVVAWVLVAWRRRRALPSG